MFLIECRLLLIEYYNEVKSKKMLMCQTDVEIGLESMPIEKRPGI